MQWYELSTSIDVFCQVTAVPQKHKSTGPQQSSAGTPCGPKKITMQQYPQNIYPCNCRAIRVLRNQKRKTKNDMYEIVLKTFTTIVRKLRKNLAGGLFLDLHELFIKIRDIFKATLICSLCNIVGFRV